MTTVGEENSRQQVGSRLAASYAYQVNMATTP